MGHCLRIAAVLAVSFFLATPASAQVVINEILPNPAGSEGGLDEKVEIYNAGPGSVDMTGWAIDDAATIGQVAVRCRIPEDLENTGGCSTSAIIGPGEYRVVHVNGSAALNNGGDDVYLVSNRLMNATVVHAVTYPATVGEGQVWACIPNGTANFAWRSPTLCASNAPPGDVTPPAAVANLIAAPGAFPGEIRLTWTAPGDDGASGTASGYIIKVSHATINAGNFDAALDLDRWITEPLPLGGGAAETLFVFGLSPDSSWCFALKAQDEVPNTSAISNSTCSSPLAGTLLDPDLGYQHYYGNLHSHTGFSDGTGTPAQAYDYARTDAQTPLDFLAVTEHNHSGAGMQLADYDVLQSQAAAANVDGQFVAIFGQEWGIIESGGHANVFESPALFGWQGGNFDVFVAEGDYTGLYTAYLANPPAGGLPPVVSWCHPASGDFESYALTADALAVVHQFAMVSGPAFSTSTTESDVGSTTGNEVLFHDALRLTFRVSPVADQDNHNANWGASTESRTVVLAAGLTKSEVLGALAARRNYASQDHNVVVDFSADGHAMGEAFEAEQGIRIAVEITDPDIADQVVEIDLLRGITGVSNAVVVATSLNNPRFAWRDRTVFPNGTQAHYYVRVRMADNAGIWSGPVYVTYEAPSTVAVGDRAGDARLELATSPNPATGRVTASFSLPQAASRGSLVVYDAAGRLVKTLLDGPIAAGPHQISWAGHDDFGRATASGIFFLRLQTDQSAVTRKFLLIR